MNNFENCLTLGPLTTFASMAVQVTRGLATMHLNPCHLPLWQFTSPSPHHMTRGLHVISHTQFPNFQNFQKIVIFVKEYPSAWANMKFYQFWSSRPNSTHNQFRSSKKLANQVPHTTRKGSGLKYFKSLF